MLNILLSYHIGSAPNYYFITSIYLLIFVMLKFKQIYSFNSKFKTLFNLSLIVQIVLINLVIFGFVGRTKPFHFDQVKKFKVCTSSIEKPIFFSKIEYYRLPWIAGNYEENPLIQNWFYDRKYENYELANTPIYKLIDSGKFQSLILTQNLEKKYNLKKYRLFKKCKLNPPINIYIKI